MTAGPLTLEDLERLERKQTGCTDGGCVFGHPGGMHTNGGCKCVQSGHVHPDEARAVRDKVKAIVADRRALLAALRAVMAERDRAESHAKRAERLAHDLQAQVLALRSLFVNWRWDGPAYIKPEEHRAMEEANRLAGGKPLDQ